MAPQLSTDTEQKILDAARTVFMRDGLEGARMQAIADEAGINKALLHYYFRSKDQLFEKIFHESVAKFFPVVRNLMVSPAPIEEKIPGFVDAYIDLLTKNPQLPVFIINEMYSHLDRLAALMGGGGENPALVFLAQYEKGAAEGRYRKVDPRQFLMTLMSVCIFPFAARPMISMLMQLTPDAFFTLMDERRAVLKDQLFALLKP